MAVPLRYIFSAADLRSFQSSPVCLDILSFLGSVNAAVAGLPLDAPVAESPFCARLLGLLRLLEGWIGEHPPLKQPMRFGNKAFRDWHARLVREAGALCGSLLAPGGGGGGGGAPRSAALQLAVYLADAFGNPTRIDYGTGHEASFLFFLCAAGACGALSATDLPCAGLRVFPAYVRACRALQRAYGLEPAGSHGVWSLDDYHIIPFLLGTSQLAPPAGGAAAGGCGEPPPRLTDAPRAEAQAAHAARYLFFDCVRAVMEVKRGAPFAETSPLLAQLCEMPSWAKANEAVARMFKAEVVGKLPVAQHFLFCSLLPASWQPSREPVPSDAGAALLAAAAAAAAAGAEGAAEAAAEGAPPPPAGGGDGDAGGAVGAADA
jgi:serine/threonine-protein phosphatase 2A activator